MKTIRFTLTFMSILLLAMGISAAQESKPQPTPDPGPTSTDQITAKTPCSDTTIEKSFDSLCPMGLYGQINGIYYYAGYLCCSDCSYCDYGQAESSVPKTPGGYCSPPCTEDCDLINLPSGFLKINTQNKRYFVDESIDEKYDRPAMGGGKKKFRDKVVRREASSPNFPGQGRGNTDWPGPVPPPFLEDNPSRNNFIVGSHAWVVRDQSYIIQDTNGTAGPSTDRRIIRCIKIRLDLDSMEKLRPRDRAKMRELGLDELNIGIEVVENEDEAGLDTIIDTDGPDSGLIRKLDAPGEAAEKRTLFSPPNTASDKDNNYVVITKPKFWK